MKRETAARILQILQSIETEAKPLAETIEQIESETEKGVPKSLGRFDRESIRGFHNADK